jgi:hypothetical protein
MEYYAVIKIFMKCLDMENSYMMSEKSGHKIVFIL